MAFDIFYLCDREKCDPCNKDCEYTKDIIHAKNFKFWAGAFWESSEKLRERERQIYILMDELKRLREEAEKEGKK